MLISIPNKNLRRIGWELAWGAIAAFCTWMLAALLIQLAIDALGWPRLDASDARDGTRSGMKLRTDHGTGCQYLETSEGGITPRLDQTGRQVCR